MIKCEICGRTIDEIVDQDGNVTIQEGMPLVCDRCQKREELKQQTEILRKAMAYDKIKKQLDCQKAMWNELKLEVEMQQAIYKVDFNTENAFMKMILKKMEELERGEKNGKNNSI